MKQLTNLDLAQNELQNFRIQNLASAPTSPVTGQVYYNSTDNKYYGYNGSAWIDISMVLSTTTISNALGFAPKKITQGVEASRPAATGSLAVYIATDTKKIYFDQAANTWLQIGGQDTIAWGNVTGKPVEYTPPMATTSILGGVKIGANLTVDANGVLNANDNPANYLIKQEKFVATEGQTAFNLTKGSYRQGLGALSIYLYGTKLSSDAFSETSTTSFTLKTGVSAGDVVLAEYVQLINVVPYPVHGNEHLTGGADPIPLVTGTTPGLMASVDKSKLDNSYTKPQVDTAISTAVNNLINGAPGALDTIKELADAMGDDPSFATTITNTLATKVDKVTGKQLSTEDFTTALLTKLNGITAGAQPNQNAVQSIQVVTSTGTAVGTSTATTTTDTLQLKEGTNIDITTSGKIITINNTYSYTHPANHPPSIITQDASNRFVTDTEKASWNSRTKKYAANVGDGTSTAITVTHSLGTMDVSVTIRESATPYNVVITDVQIVDNNSIKLLFATAPTSGQYRVVVVG
ncbi:hypothetical protein CSC2_30910 [Clostridium zeae]|uniref:Tail fiber protein n=1 Tax=Clostridium zeae TaxID=2759022 RepID=A0ABQ1ED52_9CLOT|nr:hypothetical protein [Clostridium zeae]GFZ32565.1 hypothetical protein CSC2_30910 [Clostridium zeae]